MTPPSSPLIDTMRSARVLLVDFDGPICAVFSGRPAPDVTDELRRLLAERDAGFPDDTPENGPIQLLRRVVDTYPSTTWRTVADALRDAELEAVQGATPTPGADELLRVARATGRRVAIVSNNAAEAVRAYIDGHGLAGTVDHISGRYDGMDPRLLKPSGHLIDQALVALDARPDRTILIGDSATDVYAGTAAGVAVVGLANKPGKRETLTAAGAVVVVDTLSELSSALRVS